MADKGLRPLDSEYGDRCYLNGNILEKEWYDLPKEAKLCPLALFHVSKTSRRCLLNPDVQVPLDEIEIDENLRFVEEPIEIVDQDVKKLK
ncbi:hypothetical protein Tco_1185359 [Tanacetum coccineum]